MEAQADPRDPTTGYFLHRFIVDHYGRRGGECRGVLDPFTAVSDARRLRMKRSGRSRTRLRSWRPGSRRKNCGLKTSRFASCRNRTEPHGASATFDLIRWRAGQEVGRESWSVSLQFRFLTQIPAELVIWNPMGIVISFLQGDRIVSSGG